MSRVLFVTYCFGIEHGQALIGVYKRGLRVALELANRGHQVSFFCAGRENFHDPLTALAERQVQFVDLPSVSARDRAPGANQPSLLASIAALEPDVMVVGETPMAGTLLECALCAIELEVPVVALDNAYQPIHSDMHAAVHGPLLDGMILNGASSFHDPTPRGWVCRVPQYVDVSDEETTRFMQEELGLSQEPARLVTVLAYEPKVEQLGAQLLQRLAGIESDWIFVTPDPCECRRRLAHIGLRPVESTVSIVEPPPDGVLFGLLQRSRFAVVKCGFMQVAECLTLGTPVIAFQYTGMFQIGYLPPTCWAFAYAATTAEVDDAMLAAARRFLDLEPAEVAVVHDGTRNATSRAADFIESLPRPPRNTTPECARLGFTEEVILQALSSYHPAGYVKLDLLRATRLRQLPRYQLYLLACTYTVEGQRRFLRLRGRRFASRHVAERHLERADAAGQQPRPLYVSAADRILVEPDTGESELPSPQEAQHSMLERNRSILPCIPVLNYHHVHQDEESFFRVTPARLREQMELMLKEGYKPIRPEQLADLKYADARSEKYVLVTFDDGYEDFFLYAWPILKDLAVPATLFIITDYIGGWNDWDPIRQSRRRHLDLDQLQLLKDEGVAFGSHTRSHIPLPVLGDDKLLPELRDSQRYLEEVLGISVRSLAYPGGHVNTRVRDATELYYDLGFATTSDTTERFCDPFVIPRFDPCFCPTLDDFSRALAGQSSWL